MVGRLLVATAVALWLVLPAMGAEIDSVSVNNADYQTPKSRSEGAINSFIVRVPVSSGQSAIFTPERSTASLAKTPKKH